MQKTKTKVHSLQVTAQLQTKTQQPNVELVLGVPMVIFKYNPHSERFYTVSYLLYDCTVKGISKKNIAQY